MLHIPPGHAAGDGDDAFAAAADVCPRLLQKGLKIGDLRLPGGVDDPGDAGAGAGGEHGVFRGAHAGKAQDDLSAPQVSRPAEDVAALLPDLRPQTAQRRQMQVNGPLADLAAAGQAQAGLAEACQNGAKKDHGRPHLPHQRMGHIPPAGAGGIHQNIAALPPGAAAEMLQNFQCGPHIPQVRTVM